MNLGFTDLFSDFLKLFYPPSCVACGGELVKGEDWICTGCLAQLPRPKYHLYRENPVFMRLAGRFPIDFAAAFLLFSRGGRVQHILHELKYFNKPELARYLGRVFACDLMQAGLTQRIDLIIPVPLHPLRKKKRGYNQSEEFAFGISEAANIPVDSGSVVRVRYTDSQTRKNRLLRWENVEQAFQIMKPTELKDKRVLLVDDVITTGATVEACARILSENGTSAISVAGIAFASA